MNPASLLTGGIPLGLSASSSASTALGSFSNAPIWDSPFAVGAGASASATASNGAAPAGSPNTLALVILAVAGVGLYLIARR